MTPSNVPYCDSRRQSEPSGFIGYKVLKSPKAEILRIYINCKDRSNFDGAVDVIFKRKSPTKKDGEPIFRGLNKLSMIKKFHRFIGCLEERAKEMQIPREHVFKSPKQLLTILSRVKNSKLFD